MMKIEKRFYKNHLLRNYVADKNFNFTEKILVLFPVKLLLYTAIALAVWFLRRLKVAIDL